MHTILSVDDDPDLRESLREALALRGFFVHAVPTAEVALLVLAEGCHFDLLLTDIVLPGGMNGFELADLAALVQPDLRILYMTGFANLPRRTTSELHGKIVTKPLAPNQLDREIRELLAA